MRTERFNRAFDILTQAYFNGTLHKGTCAACACGNLITAARGISIPKNLFDNHEVHQKLADSMLSAELLLWDEPKTGYTRRELSKVENAFENNTFIHWQTYAYYSEQEILEDQYNGLCAVFEVLCQLDEVTDCDYKAKLQEKEGLVLA